MEQSKAKKGKEDEEQEEQEKEVQVQEKEYQEAETKKFYESIAFLRSHQSSIHQETKAKARSNSAVVLTAESRAMAFTYVSACAIVT